MQIYRQSQDDDLEFLKKMLFEAVFWQRPEDQKPSLEEGLSYDYTAFILEDFGKRQGDLAMIAEVEGVKVGAAFIRYWHDVKSPRGYIADDIPVLIIGVSNEYRKKGIGFELVRALQNGCIGLNINKVSLCVTKTNIAYQLYKKSDFRVVEDIGDSYLMLWQPAQC